MMSHSHGKTSLLIVLKKKIVLFCGSKILRWKNNINLIKHS